MKLNIDVDHLKLISFRTSMCVYAMSRFKVQRDDDTIMIQ